MSEEQRGLQQLFRPDCPEDPAQTEPQGLKELVEEYMRPMQGSQVQRLVDGKGEVLSEHRVERRGMDSTATTQIVYLDDGTVATEEHGLCVQGHRVALGNLFHCAYDGTPCCIRCAVIWKEEEGGDGQRYYKGNLGKVKRKALLKHLFTLRKCRAT